MLEKSSKYCFVLSVFIFIFSISIYSANITSAILCGNFDDYATVYVNGNLVGNYNYINWDSSSPITCRNVPVSYLNASGTNVIAIRVQDTNGGEIWASWYMDVTYDNGQHAYVSSNQGGGRISTVYDCNNPPANDGSGNAWYSSAYANHSSWPSAVVVTGTTWGKVFYDPSTGRRLQPISYDSNGSASGHPCIYLRWGVTLTPQNPPPGPTFSITKTASRTTDITTDNITFTLRICNTGGYTTSRVYILDQWSTNEFGYDGQNSANNQQTAYGPNFSNSGQQVTVDFPNGFEGNTCINVWFRVQDYYFDMNTENCQVRNNFASIFFGGSNRGSSTVTLYMRCWSPTRTVTRTSTPTSSPTYTSTRTLTPSPSRTLTITYTYTPVPTSTFTSTRTLTITPSPSPSPSRTPTVSYTQTPSPSPSPSQSRTPTPTFSQTPTPSPSPSPTRTTTQTNTMTMTSSPSPSPTRTTTQTNTMTPTPSPSLSPTRTTTQTSTNTPSPTYSNTSSPTATSTNTRTRTMTPTLTFTDTISSNTPTATPTWTRTWTITSTPTNTYSSTQTRTLTPSYTDTRTLTPTLTFTDTISSNTPTVTRTWTNTYTVTSTFTVTSSPTNTRTNTPTLTFTDTISSNTPTITRTFTATWTITQTATSTRTNTYTFTVTLTATVTPQNTATNTYTITRTNTDTRTPTITRTDTQTWTVTATFTGTPTNTITDTSTSTATNTSTFTITPTVTMTPDLDEATLEIILLSNGENAQVGAIIEYKIIIQNLDTKVSAYNIRIWNTLPAEVEFVDNDFVIEPTLENGVLTWELLENMVLKPGEKFIIVYKVRMTKTDGKGFIRNVVSADYQDGYYNDAFGSGRHPVITSNINEYPEEPIIAYPNPYKLGVGKVINFVNLPPDCTVQIYTISGENVISLNTFTGARTMWDGNNRKSREVSPGIYYYVVLNKYSKQVVRGKIFIVK